jgi:hypothetical protein
VHGVINIVWIKEARHVDDMVRDHLADLQSAAVKIVESLRLQVSGEVKKGSGFQLFGCAVSGIPCSKATMGVQCEECMRS